MNLRKDIHLSLGQNKHDQITPRICGKPPLYFVVLFLLSISFFHHLLAVVRCLGYSVNGKLGDCSSITTSHCKFGVFSVFYNEQTITSVDATMSV